MMQYQVYQLWAAERPKTIAEQRAADARNGAIAAAMSRSVSHATRHLNSAGLLARLRRSARPAAPAVS